MSARALRARELYSEEVDLTAEVKQDDFGSLRTVVDAPRAWRKTRMIQANMRYLVSSTDMAPAVSMVQYAILASLNARMRRATPRNSTSAAASGVPTV